MAENENRDIRLKDTEGNYLYPLAREDDQGRIIKDTYLNKTGEDSYLVEATVEPYVDPTTQVEVQKLTLINGKSGSEPTIFIGGDAGYAIWGAIGGTVTDQGDLVAYTKSSISLEVSKRNKIFKQGTMPESSEYYKLQTGDMWYVVGDELEPEYHNGKWYVYQVTGESSEEHGEWVETTDSEFKEAYSRIDITDEKIETEVSERKGSDANLFSRITQTATSIKLEVGKGTRYNEPADIPPESTSERPIYPGDLWVCSQDNPPYEAGKWYIFKDGNWIEATDEEAVTTDSRVTQNSTNITSEVNRASAKEGELNSKIDQTAESIMLEVNARVKSDELNTKISQYIDSETGTAQIESTVSGKFLKKTDAEDTYETIENVAKIEEVVDSQGASISQIVTSVGSDGKVTAASIVTAVNSAGSEVKIDADHITLSGDVVMKSNLKDGVTQISGDNITTGTINASKVTISGHLSAASIDANKITVNGQSIGTSTSDRLTNLYSQNILANNISGNTITCLRPYGVHTGGDILLQTYNTSGVSNQATLTASNVTLLDGSTATWADIISGGAGGSYTAGTGINITSKKISIDTSSATTGQVLSKSASGVAWVDCTAKFG